MTQGSGSSGTAAVMPTGGRPWLGWADGARSGEPDV